MKTCHTCPLVQLGCKVSRKKIKTISDDRFLFSGDEFLTIGLPFWPKIDFDDMIKRQE